MLRELTTRALQPYTFEEHRAAAEELVESVGADGVFEVVEERAME